jgi:hypothetical protein
MACARAYTMNALEKSPPQRLSVVALLAMTAVCILQPTLSLASGKDNEWRVKYVAGSKKSQAGAKLTLAILNKEVTGKKGEDIVLQIPAASITEVGYDTSSHNRGWTWLNAGADVTTQGKGDYGGLVLAPFLVGAAMMAPFKSTQHFVRILWQEGGVPSEALFEVGKDDCGAVLKALKDLTGKPWQDLPEARKDLVAEIKSAKDRSVRLQVDHTVVLNEAEMKSGTYELILLERPDNRGEAYFFAGQEVNPEHVTAQAVVTIEPSKSEAGRLDVAYAEHMGVETIATIQFPDKKLVFDTGGLPARIAGSKHSFYGGSSRWATVVAADYKGEPALRFHVIHNPFPHVCQEYVFVTHTRVASEIAPNSPQSSCATFSAPRGEVKAVALDGKWTNGFLQVTVGGKTYNLGPLLEESDGRRRFVGLGKSRDAAREWAAFFVQTVTDFDSVEQERQTSPRP